MKSFKFYLNKCRIEMSMGLNDKYDIIVVG